MSEVDPGAGYRLLAFGEPIPKGAEYYARCEWHELATGINVGRPWSRSAFFPMRVPIKPVDNTSAEVTTSGPYVAIEVHRAALAEIDRLKLELDKRCEIWRIARDIAANERDAAESEVKRLRAELNAVKQPQPEPEPEWFDLTPFGEHVLRRDVDWVAYTDSEKWQIVGISRGAKIGQVRGYIAKARCLLKDAPPELVAMANKPAEAPDEWVTQDRVPARPGVDRYQWVSQGQSSDADNWSTVKRETTLKHGDKDNANLIFHVRCRRRDLPPMPEQKPKTETVTFYEYMVRCGVGNEDGQLKWRTSKPKTNNWIPTGRTETREVVR